MCIRDRILEILERSSRLAYIETIAIITAVSYTHLDVYKRQQLDHRKSMKSFPRTKMYLRKRLSLRSSPMSRER